MARVLVINSGSSSLKLQLVDTDGTSFATALAERIGDGVGRATVESGDGVDERVHVGPIPDHTAALQIVLRLAAEMGITPENVGVTIVGHRVVHGGRKYTQPTLVTAEVLAEIERLGELAPLHNPANLRGIRVAQEMFPDLPHVAVFDTGFFSTLPPEAFTYAVPREWDIRRYGFHGTSHGYVSDKAARFLDRPLAELNQIVLHLGNGASASAIRGGVAVDTSMGLSPLEGLVMGTRGGDIDPGALVHLMQERGMSPAELADGLNRRSGLKGMSGVSDFRELLALADSAPAPGDSAAAETRDAARLAYAVTVHRLVKYIGAYWAELGRLDVLSFTGGVGENAARLRADVVSRFAEWGLVLDDAANASGPTTRRISAPGSSAEVLVVRTNEEVAIARMARDVCGERQPDRG